MKIFAVSDLHGQLEGLDPTDADLVLIAGDFALLERLDFIGLCNQVDWVRRRFCAWCAAYSKVQFRIVPGNHDLFAQEPSLCLQIKWPSNVKLLVDEADEVDGLRLYGTPWVPFISGRWAFEAPPTGDLLREMFSAIPDGLDILLTHSPPRIPRKKIDVSIDRASPHFGSRELADAIREKSPRYAFCGHIHTGDHAPIRFGRTWIYNVSRIDENYEIRYEPLVLEI